MKQTPSSTRICRTCNEEQPIKAYLISKGYRIWKCNLCRAAKAQRNHEAVKNRKFNDLINGAFG
jgi:flavoprotein